MDENLRKKLSEPLGRLMEPQQALKKIEKKKPKMLCVVGDASMFFMLSNSVIPDVSVFDLMCKRMPVEKKWEERILAFANSRKIFYAKNPAGNLSMELENAIKECIAFGGGCVQVEGEDDLATLACICNLPSGSAVLYGQPDRGIVWVGVDEKMKKKAGKLIKEIRKG